MFTSRARVPAFSQIFAVALSVVLSSCGGTTKEAKVANALQTALANIIEGNLLVVQGSSKAGSGVSCPVSGTYTVADPAFGTIDPTDPGSTSVSSAVTFSSCVIKVCGETFTIDGGGTNIVMTAADLTGLQGSGKKSFSLTFTATNQVFTGVMEGSLSFSYKMTTTVGKSLEDIVISDTTPAVPLSLGGKTYTGSILTDLADGC